MEFSFESNRPRAGSRPKASVAGETGANDNIASDRLRKAIERNRAKQAKRSDQAARVSGDENLFNTFNSTSSPASEAPKKAPINDSEWTLPGRPARPAAETQSTASTLRSRIAARRSVGSADDVEFTTAIRKGQQSAPAPISYAEPATKKATTPTVVAKRTTKKTPKVKTKKSARGTNEYTVKGIWVFCAFLLLRLVFSDGGVQDYYAKKDVLTSRIDEQARIEKENQNLLKEIELLKKDPQHQKKVVRDHLGYIANDEYLILFPEKLN